MPRFIRLAMISLVFATVASTAASAANVNLVSNFAKTVCSKPGTVAGECFKKKSLEEEVADIDFGDEGSELSMVQLQESMNQRELAILLTTQIMGQLGGPGCEICDKIR